MSTKDGLFQISQAELWGGLFSEIDQAVQAGVDDLHMVRALLPSCNGLCQRAIAVRCPPDKAAIPARCVPRLTCQLHLRGPIVLIQKLPLIPECVTAMVSSVSQGGHAVEQARWTGVCRSSVSRRRKKPSAGARGQTNPHPGHREMHMTVDQPGQESAIRKIQKIASREVLCSRASNLSDASVPDFQNHSFPNRTCRTVEKPSC